MISTLEFSARWGNDPLTDFVGYPANALQEFGVSAEDQRFLDEVGLPEWATPHTHFFFDNGPRLPAPADPYGMPLSQEYAYLGTIGSSAEDWPICLDPTQPGKVVCLSLGDHQPSVLFMNSSIRQLAVTLMSFKEVVDEAMAFGASIGEDDPLRKRLYPRILDERLLEKIRICDPEAFESAAYWGKQLREMFREREES